MADEKPNVYSIPQNFAVEARILKGRIKLAYLVEAIIFGLIFLGPALLITKHIEGLGRISVVILMVAIPFFFGLNGISGDRASVWIANIFKWLFRRGLYLYDSTPRPLESTPLEDMISTPRLKDKLFDAYDKHQQQRAEKEVGKHMMEGVTFKFAPDDLSLADLDEEEENEETAEETKAAATPFRIRFEEQDGVEIITEKEKEL